jgi:hypothetical protein
LRRNIKTTFSSLILLLNKMWKYVLGVPFLVGVPTAAVGYKRRQEALNDPVL